MTDEGGGMGTAPEPETPAQPAAAPAVKESSTSGPESMIMLGSAVMLGGWLLFSIILDQWGTNWTPLVLAVFALMLVMGRADSFERLAPKNTLLRVAGYGIAVFALFELIWDIRFAGSALNEFVDILAALAYFGGSALIFMGARALDD
jgi:hypothetical protein